MLTNASTATTAAGTALRAKALILLITSYIVGPLDACTSTVPVTRELRRVRCDLRPREHVTNRFTVASYCCTYRIQDMRASVPVIGQYCTSI